ncbi:hypothetical protein KOW79_012701 [Hemibagrus wyckioides]|uniref:Ig-like domain-containing protein n=1 Tax=Hemibagrus wyckioides TaxID=337641 RepID=A0A9D3NM89_9TELE|nr:hypothetical protein KOW79_012701 [Hemibagrus wyckioides]
MQSGTSLYGNNVSLWLTFGGGTKLIITGPTVKPSVSLLPPSSLQLSEESASLLCLLSAYSPQGALVSWTVDGSAVKDGVVTSAEEQKKDGYMRSSTLTLSKAVWEKGEEFVSGPTVKPSVSLLPPSSLQLSEESASLLCLLSAYSPQGALVSWTVDGSAVKDGVVTSAEEQKKDGYMRSSTLTLSKAVWEKGEEFVCTVSHGGVDHPVMFRKSQCEG